MAAPVSFTRVKTKGIPNKINGKVCLTPRDEYPEDTRFPQLIGYQNKDAIISIIDNDHHIMIRDTKDNQYAKFVLYAIERHSDPNDFIAETTDVEDVTLEELVEMKCQLNALYEKLKLIMW
ncbi:MAG: hypothetical protein PHG66_00050 [Candidatus Colwellbacteria bacterium]|nr:hypothetical protein [Candidatus Colwellbacteria bacterium]